jgi:putative hydrolase of the HAD superfamily
MDNNNIEAVVFDLGNVLIDFDHTIAAKKISRFADKSLQEIFALFFDSGLTGLFEEGKISSREFFSQVKEMINLKLDYEAFLPIWNDIFFLTPKNHSVYNLANSLKGQCKIALLSNINVLHLDYLRKNFPVFDVFDHVLASCDLGLRKPDPLIYKKTLEVIGVSSAPCVFYTDDRPELVNKAQELGIKSFVFQGTEKLRRDLESAGIKTN